ncbi:zinc-binding metallopeptidase family protein [Labrys monachus]|uniref:Zinc-ribbon domain-containing protein n=1 Tax=Labrys monachus TaxID=217067 RepID=A0ABU0FED9_9HYPH|nr:putative zinc-binding peptidase [Labrys monachus]MDQ0392974.1 hypothetical protein [Labrys monachus]
MKLFQCQHCGLAVHFDNTFCVNCHHRIGYLQDRFEMTALEPDGDAWRALADPEKRYFFCENEKYDVCNWLVPEGGETFCESCRHNRTIPDLSFPENHLKWQKIELAKRYLFRSLMRWHLPTRSRAEDPDSGLVFDFVADVVRPDGTVERVMTGHDEGVITLNIAEADDVERESRRRSMGESYRTLLGHFRHEVGHYYWDRLVRDGQEFESFRAVFGDERDDYGAALQRYYESGPPADWQDSFISAYATAHPWEDFAESWAHYIHMVDAIETALAYGIDVKSRFGPANTRKIDARFEPYAAGSVDELINAWVPLTIAINGVNRSMGQPDLYPFVLSHPVTVKLQYIHDLIHGAEH